MKLFFTIIAAASFGCLLTGCSSDEVEYETYSDQVIDEPDNFPE